MTIGQEAARVASRLAAEASRPGVESPFLDKFEYLNTCGVAL
jgi:hypothetical protein